MTDAPFSKNVPPESKQVIQSVAASQPGHTRFKRAFAIGCAEVRQTIRATAAHISACLAFSRQQIASWSLYRQCRARKMQLADAMIKTGAAGDKLRARLAELSTRKPDDRIELLGFSTGRQLSELKLRIADDALSKTTSPEQVKCQLRAAQDAVREFRDAECEC